MFSLTRLLTPRTPQHYVALKLKHTQTTPVQMSYTSFETAEAKLPPLIIMHGLFGSKANWNSLCKAFTKQLNPRRNVFSVDARNHGDSVHSPTHTYEDLVEDIRLFMRELGVDRSALLGHSMGGRAVMLCALKYVGVWISRAVVQTCNARILKLKMLLFVTAATCRQANRGGYFPDERYEFWVHPQPF